MVDENELQKPKENIKASSRKKTIMIATGLIVFFLSLSAVGFYSYQNGMFDNLYNVKSTKHIATEGEKNIVEEIQTEPKPSIGTVNIVEETVKEGENSESNIN
jgi:hypothetical protein